MKSSSLLAAMAAACFCAPLLLAAQQAAPQQAAPQQGVPQQPAAQSGAQGSVQVGVPAGRGGAPAGGPGRGRGTPAGPVPRSANGRALWGGSTPSQKGVWLPGGGGGQTTTEGIVIPYQPWAKALAADRDKNRLEPHTRCKPSGIARQFLTPYGVEIVDLPEIDRVFIFDIGGPHTYRTIYTDGRVHPVDVTPSYYGHSIGWWEGDTLVVDTTGFNESFWMDRVGTPHTSKLHTLEKLTRTDANTIRYEITVNDPGAFTQPWTTRFNLSWEDGTELFEYQCQQANYAHTLMLGAMESVDRSSPIVP